MIRNPAVAGQFYPGKPEALRSYVASATQSDTPPIHVFGLIAPHAGYMYSGAVAGAVFGRVAVPGTVLLLGPNHTGMGTPASIVTTGAWRTPLGESPVDSGFAQALRDACPLLEEDSLAHAQEHSLEVQLPFLQVRNPGVRIVPIAFLLGSFREIEEIGNNVASVLKRWEEPVLVVASSDMTHYESAASAEAKDRLAIDKVLELDPVGLLTITQEHRISMCGVIPTAVMLVAARAAGCERGELVRYATSGDVSGDYGQVVGYAGMLVH